MFIELFHFILENMTIQSAEPIQIVFFTKNLEQQLVE